MGLFSKLLKDVTEAAAQQKWDEAVDKVRSSETIRDLAEKVKTGVNALESEIAAREEQARAFSERAGGQPQEDRENSFPADNDRTGASQATSGSSYGPDIPAEENQFTCGVPFQEYFEGIFRDEFPDWHFEKEELSPRRRFAYTFYSGDRKALVVELMSETCSANKLRISCEREGIPYVRFYFDHEGWWNTRSYVTRRLHEAV